MARRIAWTSNSTGHDGTTIHRSTATMDPQALPAPLATVAAGVTEHIDVEDLADGTYYYRVQDYQGASVSAASGEITLTITPDYSTAQIGDEIDGGIYAGIITYADEREFHLIFGKQTSEAYGLTWGDSPTVTGATDPDDGKSNQDLVLTNFDNGNSSAFHHCRDYTDARGNNDYYMPSRNELAKGQVLADMGHSDFSTDRATFRWSSTEDNAYNVFVHRYSDDKVTTINGAKLNSSRIVRPVRRVAV